MARAGARRDAGSAASADQAAAKCSFRLVRVGLGGPLLFAVNTKIRNPKICTFAGFSSDPQALRSLTGS
jgi:hypothetical protein